MRGLAAQELVRPSWSHQLLGGGEAISLQGGLSSGWSEGMPKFTLLLCGFGDTVTAVYQEFRT